MTIREIPLTRGKTALIDEADWEIVARHKWAARKSTNTFYAQTSLMRRDGKQRTLLLHRLLLKGARLIDHVDGNGLNNTRSNLRVCTHSQNIMNSALKTDPRKTSRFKGVSRSGRKWRITVEAAGHRVELGPYDTEEAAARAYDAAARLFQGKFARTNRDLGLLP